MLAYTRAVAAATKPAVLGIEELAARVRKLPSAADLD